MNHSLASCFIFFLLLLLLFIITVGADDRFTNCSSRISCGTVDNVGYPFWGENRAEYCGQPGFQLACQDNTPKLIFNAVTYRILKFNLSDKSLTVARDDYWQTLCPNQYLNTSFDSTSFKLADGFQDIALLYDCIKSFNSAGQFTTSSSAECSKQKVYYGSLSTYNIDLTGICKVVVVPIASANVNLIFSDEKEIEDAIKDGFELGWSVNNEQYNNCVNSGGQCGYINNKFTCFCSNGRQGTTCSGKSSKAVAIGVGVGVAVFFGIVIMFLLCFVMKRRRKRKAEELKSKNLLSPSLSNINVNGDVTTSATTTNMAQTAPSYPTSKFHSVQKSFYFGVQVFSYEELEEATQNFDPSMELGDGGFGTVYYGTLKDGRIVAVKRHYESNAKRVEQYMNEVEILGRLRHDNLVALYGCTSRHSRELILVYEYIPNGTVADHLHGKRSYSTLLPWPIRMNIAVETAEALSFLHKSDVIHRDVKTNNILLDNDFRVKVADFGLSRLFPNHVTHVSTAPQGTPGYVDPEYYQCFQLTDKSDVYSFGVVLIELISSLQAVDVSRSHRDINLANMALNKIQDKAVHELVDPYLGFEKDYGVRQMIIGVAELAFRCLQKERDMRPSMEEVVEILREIQRKEFVGEKEVVMMDKVEELVLLKNGSAPFSPDSVTDKWVSYSSTSNSSQNLLSPSAGKT
ncbi:LEAF RUST 10 DISEASE-RESISTANCE LOCUS RECEPTOR-LIKE PROTEIN KINASE-like 1.4 [Prosopis cineraria]|uniref:LEAF RUST 10 DISEASE-RESISTANCE LOCUS RECEPTOR-LIKE PROTEIN KINASE-like 1.4 n=1 Tax=Prosopis cineraria TaxID=364024 RepID=UPI00240FB076|nr:LEAF RUST 10 DISEASE-RESISTANCE LOCUS RECEPTOR-LIKE PROTEIN KINASE-like 1.4 [Prosopis cineraria]